MDFLHNRLNELAVGRSLAETPHIVMFGVTLLLALLIGRWTPAIARFILGHFLPTAVMGHYRQLMEPIQGSIRWAGTAIWVSLATIWLQEDFASLYGFLRPFIDLWVIGSVAWFISRLCRQIFRIYGVEVLRQLGLEADELLLVFETVVNVVIGLIAVLVFAQTQNFNLVGLFASLGIGGIAVAFASQKILEQLLSTIVLYLDRPFVPGEYIRLADGQLGRVESIGLRSTKVRTAGKSTLVIIPNSQLISMEIENVTRAKKVMVMLYFDFARPLSDEDAALVKQVISQSTDSVFGVDPGSTSIVFTPSGENGRRSQQMRRARITFFILGSNDNSIELRKRLLQLANETIARRLDGYGIQFMTQDPTVYVESPVTL